MSNESLDGPGERLTESCNLNQYLLFERGDLDLPQMV
jgi:hypothetical protein